MTIQKIMVVDDHPIFLKGLTALINDLSFCKVVGSAVNGKKCLELIKTIDPDIIFMDVKMPIMNGIEATEKALEVDPTVKIIALTMFNENKYVALMRQAGAKGFITKNTRKEKLMRAIEVVASGGEFFDEEELEGDDNSSIPLERIDVDDLQINERERGVLKYICEGFSAHEIAERMHLSPRTVEGYRTNLISKTNSKNTAQMVTYAIQYGLVTLKVD